MISCVFDTETTGIPKHPHAKDAVQPHVIEFAAVLVDEDGNELDEIVQLVKPVDERGVQIPLEEVITKITGITDEDLVDAPTWSEVRGRILAFINSAGRLIAHNGPFDVTMVELAEARLGYHNVAWPEERLCTVQEHAEEWGFRPKLTQLYEHYTGEALQQTHRALDDVRGLVVVCKAAGVLT